LYGIIVFKYWGSAVKKNELGGLQGRRDLKILVAAPEGKENNVGASGRTMSRLNWHVRLLAFSLAKVIVQWQDNAISETKLLL
jgi:hypothetical protein